jgi:flavin reductase (DIM6/NTAB) family NADH-FMN oxidoreductase RutF
LFGEQIGGEVDKVARCRWRPGPGRPLLEGCEHWFAGRVPDRMGTGDHVAVLVQPVAAAAGWIGGQLGFRDVQSLQPDHPP